MYQIKSSLYSPYYAEACNELRGPSPRLCAQATQLRRNVATVASRWRHCVDLTGPGIEHHTSRTDSVRLATELTAGSLVVYLFVYPPITRKRSMRYTSSLRSCQPSVYLTKMGKSHKCLSQRHKSTCLLVLHTVPLMLCVKQGSCKYQF